LAKERGTFPIWDWNIEKDNIFIQRLPDWLKDDICKYGRRNISNLTVAPTGSVSILAQCSSGLEPVFKNSYIRRRKLNHNEQDKKEHFIDDIGDKWIEFEVFHHNVKEWMELNPKKQLPEFFVESGDINYEYRIKLQSVIGQMIDHSISSCLSAGDHLVSTKDGLRYVEEFSGDKIGFNEPKLKTKTFNHENKVVNIDEGYYNGEAECLRVTLDYNQEIVATPNHKLFVLGDNYEGTWKRVDELKPEDYVIGRMGLGNFGDSTKNISSVLGKFNISKTRNSHNCKSVNFPKRITKDFARFLGYLVSDGSISDNGCALSQLKNNVSMEFINIGKSIFGFDPYISEDARAENLLGITFNSRIVREYLEDYIGITRSALTKHVPLVIFACAGRRQTVEFIRGLTLDGHVGVDSVSPITTISERLAKEVQTLLLEFGIESGVYTHEAGERKFPSGKTYKTKKSYCVVCSGANANRFVDIIGFAEERKQEECLVKFRRTSRKKLAGSVPDFGIREQVRKELLPNIKSNKMYDYIHSFSCSSKKKFGISRDNLLMLEDLGLDVPEILVDETFRFVKVKSIHNAGIRKTYDLHIKDGNSYLVNGLISHNTINLPKGTSSEVVGNLYIKGWEAGLKGLTVYVDGSRSGVLVDKNYKKQRFNYIQAPDRPEELECDIHTASIKGDKWIILVGLMDGRPYEVFGGLSENIEIPSKYKKGTIIKVTNNKNRVNRYDLRLNGVKIKNIIKMFDNTAYQVHTRMVSLGLRHGARPSFLVEQLQKDPDNDLTSFNKVLARVLKKYIEDGTIVTGGGDRVCPECNTDNLVYQEGCVTCTSCGWSRCS
jgi:intein/homing endonuclease